MKNIFLLILISFFFVSISFAQEKVQEKEKKEKSKIVRDTSRISHRANRAALFSSVVPGAGQFYNKKYWKLPILYGGGVALGLAIEYNNRFYKIFREAYSWRVDTDSTTIDKFDPESSSDNVKYPDADALKLRRDYYRRTRDLMWIIGGVVYVLNIIDAYVDAHLANFDVSDNLSLRAEPYLQLNRNYEPVASVRLSFNLH